MKMPRTALILLACLALAGCVKCKDVKPAPQTPPETSLQTSEETLPLTRPKAAPLDE